MWSTVPADGQDSTLSEDPDHHRVPRAALEQSRLHTRQEGMRPSWHVNISKRHLLSFPRIFSSFKEEG